MGTCTGAHGSCCLRDLCNYAWYVLCSIAFFHFDTWPHSNPGNYSFYQTCGPQGICPKGNRSYTEVYIAHGYSATMTGIWLPSSSKSLRYFYSLLSFYYWYCLRLWAMPSNHFLEHQRYLAYITYYWSMKASLQIGSKWGRTVLIPVSIPHLMLGLCCLVSIMIQWMSRCLPFSAQVCSQHLGVISLTHFKLVLDPTTKDSYIKHYFMPPYQVAAIVNIHNIVSTYILKPGYYWMPLVSWVLWHVSHQISHTGYSQYCITWANSQPNPCRSVWVIMLPCGKPSSLWTRDLKQQSLCRAGPLPQQSTWIPRCWYAEFLDGA